MWPRAIPRRPATSARPGTSAGKTGTVERICGEYKNPEQLAFGDYDAARYPLYRVRFDQAHVWPDYDGPAADTVDVEIFEHWLEPAEGN